MNIKLRTLAVIAGLVLFAAGPYSAASAKMASEVYQPVDPNKKKAGEECKTSDECQKHHACAPAGDKTVCTAPPRPKHKPGVVT